MSGSKPQEFTIDQIPELLMSNARMKDKNLVEKKLRQIISDGKEKLQIITDFDRTLSKHHHNGVLTKSSYGVFDSIPSLPETFLENASALYHRFRVIEDDPGMTIQEKVPHMQEWWLLSEKLFIGLKCTEKEIRDAVVHSEVKLRDGTDSAFDKLTSNDVPILVFSAGLGDVVKAIMKHYKIYSDSIKIISNFFTIENEIITGFQGTLIHVYNKNEHAIENCAYFEELSHRNNVILMGDSLGDAHMSEGLPNEGVVLKIGFLSVNIEDYLPQYLENFDIVLIDDQTMNVFNSMLNFIL